MEKIQHKNIQVNGINMHVAELGEGPVVLFLHGFPELWYTWRHQMLFIASKGYHAIAPDLRGFGDTEAPSSPTCYTAFHIVGDLVCLLDSLGLDKVYLVGHDWGAIIAWYLCLFRPDRIKALVNMSVVYAPRDPLVKPLEKWRKTFGDDFYVCRFQEIGWEEEYGKVDTKRQLAATYFKRNPGLPKLPKDYAKVFNPPPYTLPSWFTEEDLDYFASKYSATGFTGGFNYYRCFDLNWELCAAWMGSKIKVPVKFIVGDLDLTYHSPGTKEYIHSGGFKELVPGLEEVVVMEGVGHFINQERPEEINNHIYDFITKFNSVTTLIFVYFKGIILFRVWLFIECGCDGWCSSKWTTWILYWLNRGMIHLSVYLWLRFQSFSASDQTSGIIVIARISDSVGVPIATTATESLTDLSETQDAPTPRTSSRSPAGKSYNVLRGYMEYFCSVLTFGFALKEVCVSVLGYLNRFSKGEFWETRSSSLVLVESFEKMMEDPKCTKDGLIRKMVLEPCGNNEGGMEVPVAEVVQNATRVSGKRSKNDIAMAVIEISLDELMRNRPREAQPLEKGQASLKTDFELVVLRLLLIEVPGNIQACVKRAIDRGENLTNLNDKAENLRDSEYVVLRFFYLFRHNNLRKWVPKSEGRCGVFHPAEGHLRMEQKQICCGSVYDRIPPLSANHPWFVAQNLDAEDETEVQIFYNVHDPLRHYRCRIPELFGKRIRGCFYGWVILSSHPSNDMWSLWNPVTSKLYPKRKKLRWTEMSYAKMVTQVTRVDGFLLRLTCCNGKVYAFATKSRHVVEISIVVKGKEVLIKLLPLLKLPSPSSNGCDVVNYLAGSCTDLFTILIGLEDITEAIGHVYLFKLNMNSMTWEEMEDLKDATFSLFIDDYLCPKFYSPAIESEFGGYIHIIGEHGKVIYSYHVKDKTLSLSSMPCQLGISHISVWATLECKRLLEGDHKQEEDKNNEIVAHKVKGHEVEFNDTTDESHLLNLPFNVLELIMEFSVGVEYMNFRATCKLCHLAAPSIQWSNQIASKRLQSQAYSSVSPWLMVFDKHTITFFDPMFGDKYFIKTPRELELVGELKIHCSRYGWLLMRKSDGPLSFFNPFTSDTRELPRDPSLESFGFSAPPSSPDCMVVGFTSIYEWHVHVLFVGRESSWCEYALSYGDNDPYFYRFPAFCGQDVYALCNEKGVDVFKKFGDGELSWDIVLEEAPLSSCTSRAQRFLVKCDHEEKCDQHLMLVIVGEFGESIEVFIPNEDEDKWEKIDGIGRHAIFICDKTSICIEAKLPEMENKIYFPRLHSGKIMFYSLETCKFHAFNSKNIRESFGDFFGTWWSNHRSTPVVDPSVEKMSLGELVTQSSSHYFIDETGATKTVVLYFRENYDVQLRFPALPAIQAGTDAKPTHLPMEICWLTPGQRYALKLNERQVTHSLRATCQRQKDREESIQNTMRPNKYIKDPLLNKNFEMHKVINGGTVNYWTIGRMNKTVGRFVHGLVSMCPSKGIVGRRNTVMCATLNGRLPYVTNWPTIYCGPMSLIVSLEMISALRLPLWLLRWTGHKVQGPCSCTLHNHIGRNSFRTCTQPVLVLREFPPACYAHMAGCIQSSVLHGA
ncbi:hypothetical protein CTI12_AA342050 [Artemisia annua]|uniref:soluble epoxide hydrolase n=1 Tax=Artemisia annua TaxID=35608 RepID=A0A2U1MTZ1_ARTAN|nr:hypothetical protein CTI12_AA342050 [Artemisia annua]